MAFIRRDNSGCAVSTSLICDLRRTPAGRNVSEVWLGDQHWQMVVPLTIILTDLEVMKDIWLFASSPEFCGMLFFVNEFRVQFTDAGNCYKVLFALFTWFFFL